MYAQPIYCSYSLPSVPMTLPLTCRLICCTIDSFFMCVCSHRDKVLTGESILQPWVCLCEPLPRKEALCGPSPFQAERKVCFRHAEAQTDCWKGLLHNVIWCHSTKLRFTEWTDLFWFSCLQLCLWTLTCFVRIGAKIHIALVFNSHFQIAIIAWFAMHGGKKCIIDSPNSSCTYW